MRTEQSTVHGETPREMRAWENVAVITAATVLGVILGLDKKYFQDLRNISLNRTTEPSTRRDAPVNRV